MNAKKERLSAIAAILAAVAWTGGLPGLCQPAQPGEVEGRVVEDSSGDPLASAELRFHRSGWEISHLRSVSRQLPADGERSARQSRTA